MHPEIDTIFVEAGERLVSAQHGLRDMRGPPDKRRIGYYNAIVFGRMMTLALQNLRGKISGFDAWYEPIRKELASDKLFKFFYEERTVIEKTAFSNLVSGFHAGEISNSEILRMAEKFRPRGAKYFVIGDRTGGSGWVVPNSDGTETTHYIDLEVEGAYDGLYLPANLNWKNRVIPGSTEEYVPAEPLVKEYIEKMQEIYEGAKKQFGWKPFSLSDIEMRLQTIRTRE
ncbi:hypothetical protein [Roseomonas sp. BN140053]|uniref:hypothetical protein n=1 Tax=Roseomonas sp. BN140053 TaxID=3391898 RepID=UPI0039ECC771